jgi:hypothetical protein
METQKVQTMGEPPGLALYRIGVGHYFSRALALAAKLGVADFLKDGPRHYEDLAAATKTHPPSLNRVLRLLASIGVFEEREGGIFALTPMAELLRTGVPGSMRSSVQLFAGVGIQDSWKELEYCIQTGEPAFRRHSPDSDPFVQIAQNPEMAKVFDEAMATFAPVTAAAIAAAYDFSSFGKLVDIGGGNGSLLVGILKANPKLHGIVFDMPHAAEKARAKITEAGLQSRCEAIGGDFFKEVPPGADAYIIKHVIHDWNDERAAAILRSVRQAMPPRARLLIAEGVYPARIDQSDAGRGAAANDVNMLVCTGGRQRSEAEFHSLYAASGFKLTRIVPTPARLSLIEGTRA